MDRNIRDRLESAISKLLLYNPLYGEVFLFLNKIESKTIKTMAVGVIRQVDLALYYNEEFIKGLSGDELRAVLKHEALHILLHHLVRVRHGAFNPKGFNIAADMAINCHILNLPTSAIYPKTFELPDGQSADWYYKSLKEEAEKRKQDLEQMLADKGVETVDDHGLWGEFDEEIVSEKIKNIAESAIKAQEKKGWGDTPGGLVEQIIAANKPVVNWKKEVKWFINKVVELGRKNTRMRPNRRYIFQSPGTKRDYTSRLLVAFDTSGSVSSEQLTYFTTELNGMIDHVICDFIQFDCQINGKPEKFSKKAAKIDIKGRGGTNFGPVIQLADNEGYDGLVIFTDGYAPFPPKPKVRLLWAVCSRDSSVEFPYGKKVIIEEKKK